MSQKQKILVAGGAGYIGSHTCKRLALAGFEPITLDNLTTGFKHNVKWGPFVEGNIADQALVKKIINQYDIHAVIHFAASAYVGESILHPRKYFENNVVGTLNLLNALLDCDVKHIVFSSTCATYGVPQTVPISEENSQLPINPYGDSKLFVEKILKWYQLQYGLESVVLRYFNAAGADPDGEIGEEHNPETHLIPLVIQALRGQVPELKVFGTDYATPDGTAMRDYIHVSDLAEAHVLSLMHLQSGKGSVALNLGMGISYSVLDVVRSAEKISGKKCPVKYAPRRVGDPSILTSNSTKAKNVLRWQVHYTELDRIIETAWKWHNHTPKKMAAQL